MVPRSVRTCVVCKRRRHAPGFVAVDYAEEALYALCEGCLAATDVARRVAAFLALLKGRQSWMYYVLGAGSLAAQRVVPVLEAPAQQRVIVRELRGLGEGRKAFWQRVYAGPAPAGHEVWRGWRVVWSPEVWPHQGWQGWRYS